jgi:hypothetical protein
MISILDLPVVPKDRDGACETDTISSTFLLERNSVDTVEKFIQFINRWKNLWLIRNERTSQEEKDISELRFNVQPVFELFILAKDSKEIDLRSDDARITMNIVVPPAVLTAFIIAKHFGVGIDLAFVRLYLDPYPEFDNVLRCF